MAMDSQEWTRRPGSGSLDQFGSSGTQILTLSTPGYGSFIDPLNTTIQLPAAMAPTPDGPAGLTGISLPPMPTQAAFDIGGGALASQPVGSPNIAASPAVIGIKPAAISAAVVHTIATGQTLSFASGLNLGAIFNGESGALELGSIAGSSATISNFGPTNEVILDARSGDGVSLSGNHLFIEHGGNAVGTFDITGNLSGASFGIVSAGGNETLTGIAPQMEFFNSTIALSDPNNYGGAKDAGLVADLQQAIDDWAHYAYGVGTLAVELSIVSSFAGDPNALSTGGPATNSYSEIVNGETIYQPSSLYELTTGKHAPGYTNDIVINIPSTALGEIYINPTPSSSGSVPANEYDAVTIFRHELTHGLGFIGFRNPTTGVLPSYATLFDHYSTITSTGADYFIGPHAEAVYGGPVPLTTLQNGEQYYHLANQASDSLAQDLMNGIGLYPGTIHTISAVDIAILQDVGLPVTGFMPCFAAGVLILTARGEVPVEEMRVGDEVVLGRGGLAPVQWIGRRHIDLARHPRPGSVQPVRLRAGSIIDGVPRRDLYLSPDHALYLDGILVPAKALLNGETIAQLSVSQVVYYHIELAAHDVIFADGTPVETYLDCGNRAAFENGPGAVHLHADFASAFRHEASYAPVWEAGDKVEAIRARLLARCSTRRSDDPTIRLVQGCHELALQWAGETMLHAVLAADAGDVMVMSRNAIPGEISPDPRDRRRLGVALGEILLGGPAGIRRIGLDHPDLVTGWHEVEAGQRWTDGAAIIPARLLGDASWIRLRFVAKLSYAQAA
jgi:hypothetical protein